MILSMMKAARAIYPVSSKIDMKKYNIKILGKNTITPPTPEIIPSTIKSLIGPSLMFSPMKAPNKLTPASIQSIG